MSVRSIGRSFQAVGSANEQDLSQNSRQVLGTSQRLLVVERNLERDGVIAVTVSSLMMKSCQRNLEHDGVIAVAVSCLMM